MSLSSSPLLSSLHMPESTLAERDPVPIPSTQHVQQVQLSQSKVENLFHCQGFIQDFELGGGGGGNRMVAG